METTKASYGFECETVKITAKISVSLSCGDLFIAEEVIQKFVNDMESVKTGLLIGTAKKMTAEDLRKEREAAADE